MSLAGVARDLGSERPPMLITGRRRIASELQIETIHRLFGVGLKLQALSTGSSDPVVSSRLDACVHELDVAISDFRALIVSMGARDV